MCVEIVKENYMKKNNYLEKLVSNSQKCIDCKMRHYDTNNKTFYCYFASQCWKKELEKEAD